MGFTSFNPSYGLHILAAIERSAWVSAVGQISEPIRGPEIGSTGQPQAGSLIAGARSTNFRSVLERTAVRDNALAWNSLTA
jgi:hypothetical protein